MKHKKLKVRKWIPDVDGAFVGRGRLLDISSPHIVRFINGTYGIRRLQGDGLYAYADVDSVWDRFWWVKPKYSGISDFDIWCTRNYFGLLLYIVCRVPIGVVIELLMYKQTGVLWK